MSPPAVPEEALGRMQPDGGAGAGAGAGRNKPMQGMRSVASMLICAALWLACGDGDRPAPAAAEGSSEQSWVRRYVPRGSVKYRDEDGWRPSSEVPRVRETKPGMVVFEVSQFPPGSKPTEEQRLAADDMLERCYASALRHGWHEFERGLADGFRAVDRHHHRNDDYMLDDHVIDPDRPEVLIYYATPPDGEKRLAGFMFYASDRNARGPQFGGPLTIWHYHSWFRPQCVVNGLSVNWSVGGKCAEGKPSYFSGEMMHVWLIDHPEGHFATPMHLPYSTLGPLLEKRRRERGF